MHTWMGKVCFFPFELKNKHAEKKRPNQLVLFASFFFTFYFQ